MHFFLMLIPLKALQKEKNACRSGRNTFSSYVLSWTDNTQYFCGLKIINSVKLSDAKLPSPAYSLQRGSPTTRPWPLCSLAREPGGGWHERDGRLREPAGGMRGVSGLYERASGWHKRVSGRHERGRWTR